MADLDPIESELPSDELSNDELSDVAGGAVVFGGTTGGKLPGTMSGTTGGTF